MTTVTGDFVFSNITGDTYLVRVSMDGFKTVERRGIAVSPGDRVVVPALNLRSVRSLKRCWSLVTPR